jgi:4-oxalocrotonate tautomerase
MPLTQIFLRGGKPTGYRLAIAESLQKALTDALGVPAEERFQLITEFGKDNFIFDPSYKNISRSQDLVMIVITLKAGRSNELKKTLYQTIVTELGNSPKIRREDVLIVLHENGPADWSFGDGGAQLLD